ncbi:MAG TPA: AEC family transporter [Chondromyces sp.]|nr:AEC family transporter [Chondromyces sp.]
MEFIMIVLPAFLIFLIGYIGQKTIGFNIKSISTAALYLMYPFLSFRTFYTNSMTIEYIYIFIFCILLCATMTGVVLITSKIRKSPRSITAAFILSGVFMNAGNYGTPIILFAFGGAGFDYAIIMMIVQSLLMNTIGLYIAAMGGSEKSSMKESLMKVAKMPMIHGAIIGAFFHAASITVPESVMGAIDLVADATIPTIMIVLGMQLAAFNKQRVKLSDVSLIVMIKMFLSPLAAYIIITLMPIEGLLAGILIILSAMPSAANTAMVSLQFNTEPDLVSFTTLVTTIISIVTIPLLLMWVM